MLFLTGKSETYTSHALVNDSGNERLSLVANLDLATTVRVVVGVTAVKGLHDLVRDGNDVVGVAVHPSAGAGTRCVVSGKTVRGASGGSR
jgi:hypothetical protein